jgi:uncharacterized protein YndB with AHSA1/START domain
MTTARAQFSIQRTYAASIDEAWALWTTKSGIESWWGPEGFNVTVTSLDLRPGDHLVYLMTAVAPDQAAFMRRAGMPLTSECKVAYTEISPPSRLAYKTLADFVPGVAPYEVAVCPARRMVSTQYLLRFGVTCLRRGSRMRVA